jgi:hypothetical protein
LAQKANIIEVDVDRHGELHSSMCRERSNHSFTTTPRSAQPTPRSVPLPQPKPTPRKPTPRLAPRPSTQATPSTTKLRSAPLRQPKPCRVLPKLFFSFLLWRTENRRREWRKRTEKRGRAEEKKLKRKKISGKMKDKGKKKKKSLNRRVNWRVGNSFLMDEECMLFKNKKLL